MKAFHVRHRRSQVEAPVRHPRALVLGAGKGKRLGSEALQIPKVLRLANGRPLLSYVLDALDFIPQENICLVVGFQGDTVLATVDSHHPYVYQREQLGTGHAVAQAREWISQGSGPVLCCYGDMPLITKETYRNMLALHEAEGNDCTLLAYKTDLDLAYGRILRDERGHFVSVVEDKDCTPEQKQIHEYNAGVYVFEPEALLKGLERLNNRNQQGEYYLTDVPGFLKKVDVYTCDGRYEGLGVNTVEDLEMVSRCLAEHEQALRFDR